MAQVRVVVEVQEGRSDHVSHLFWRRHENKELRPNNYGRLDSEYFHERHRFAHSGFSGYSDILKIEEKNPRGLFTGVYR